MEIREWIAHTSFFGCGRQWARSEGYFDCKLGSKWVWLIVKAVSKVLKLAKVEKSSGTNSTAKANPADAS